MRSKPSDSTSGVVPTTTIADVGVAGERDRALELVVAERRLEVELERDADAAVVGPDEPRQDDRELLAGGERDRDAMLRRREEVLAGVGVRAQRERARRTPRSPSSVSR